MDNLQNNIDPNKKESPFNLIWVSIGFSLIYWLLESVRDVISYERGNILERIFMPDAMSLWMRLLVVCILVLFGVYAQSLKIKLESKKEEKRQSRRMVSVFASGLSFGALYWLLESVRDWFVYSKGNVLEQMFFPSTVDFWMRLMAVFVIVLFSVYIQNLIDERKHIEKSLTDARDKLEVLVNERTNELQHSNTMLQQQVSERLKAESALRKVNRSLKTLSQCNETMIKAEEEGALLNQICQTLVKVGGYELVWVGYLKKNEEEPFQLMAKAARMSRHLALVEQTERIWKTEKNLMQESLTTGKPMVISDFFENDQFELVNDMLRETGFESMVSLPLHVHNRPVGALNIFSLDAFRFDGEEMSLLQELTNNLTYGITALRTQAENRKIAEEKSEIQVQLLHSQKMEAIGTLAGGVAHDFNNLLTAIQVSADLAMMQSEETDPAFLELKEIRQVSIHAAELAKQLLLFSRKHPMEFTTIQLNKNIEVLRKMLIRMIGEDIKLETNLSPDLWSIQGDKGTLEQILMNLTLNGKDAMPNGGKLAISAENVELDAGKAAQMHGAREGNFVKISVRDQGTGIPAENLEHIFEPFFTTKGPGKGTGLGLSVVYGIVQEHKGWIHVESELGNGSCFEVYIPGRPALVSEKASPSVDYSLLRGHGERILLIEDEVRVREFTAKGLEKNNYRVYTASTAEEALALFKKEKGEFNLVLSDIGLPDQNGFKLANTLLKKKPGLPILLSSGYGDSPSKYDIEKSPGLRYLEKPFALPELLRVVKNMAS